MNYNTTNDKGTFRWPDSYLGSEEYYSIDCSYYLEAENDLLVAVEWTVPPELTSMDEVVVGSEAFIKLSADTVGNHIIKFKLDSTESGKDQIVQERVKLVVLDI